MQYAAHGTNLDAAYAVVRDCLNRGSRAHIHTIGGGEMGRPKHSQCRFRG